MPGELFHISRTCIQDFLSKLPFRLVDPFRVKSCDISYRISPKWLLILWIWSSMILFFWQTESVGFVSDRFIQRCLLFLEWEIEDPNVRRPQLWVNSYRSASGATTSGAGTLERGTSALGVEIPWWFTPLESSSLSYSPTLDARKEIQLVSCVHEIVYIISFVYAFRPLKHVYFWCFATHEHVTSCSVFLGRAKKKEAQKRFWTNDVGFACKPPGLLHNAHTESIRITSNHHCHSLPGCSLMLGLGCQTMRKRFWASGYLCSKTLRARVSWDP